jgi:PTS system cellobiose-specific IIC component
MSWGLIQKPYVNVPWTTPPIIGHFLVSGGDWRAAVWGCISIVMAMAVYYPFAKVAERQRLQAEAAGHAIDGVEELLHRCLHGRLEELDPKEDLFTTL